MGETRAWVDLAFISREHVCHSIQTLHTELRLPVGSRRTFSAYSLGLAGTLPCECTPSMVRHMTPFGLVSCSCGGRRSWRTLSWRSTQTHTRARAHTHTYTREQRSDVLCFHGVKGEPATTEGMGRLLTKDQRAVQRDIEAGIPTAVNCGEPVAG